jgi:hypothetical protein
MRLFLEFSIRSSNMSDAYELETIPCVPYTADLREMKGSSLDMVSAKFERESKSKKGRRERDKRLKG